MKRKFTKEQREKLLQNKNVKAVTSVAVIYQDSFKYQAIDLYNQGFLATDIFINAGFDLDIIGKENPAKILSKWRSSDFIPAKKHNNDNFVKSKSSSKYSDKEIKKIIARNTYLEAENNFLKKLQALENQLK